MDEIIMSTKDKVLALYEFTKELNALRQKTKINIKDYEWHRTLASFPDDPENISIAFPDRTGDGAEIHDEVLTISVHKPEFEKCPEPDASLLEWLSPDWDYFKNDVHYIEYKAYDSTGKVATLPDEVVNTIKANSENHSDLQEFQLPEGIHISFFRDDEQRVSKYDEWKRKREIWVDKQRLLDETRKLFSDFFQQFTELQRDPDSFELIAVNGFIRASNNENIDQGILTRRVNLTYDAAENTITLTDSDVGSELYSALFQELPGLATEKLLGIFNNELSENDYHPFDRYCTPDFLRRMIRSFSSESYFCEGDVPKNWQVDHRYLMYLNPAIVLRKRTIGTIAAIERIIKHIADTGEIPDPIRRLVSGNQEPEIPPYFGEPPIEELLAEAGGESRDIYLTKEANKEQLEIARRINEHEAVLVQGPPGTGKTHTIANLVGHFLAEGKRVLITSYTTKALSVLKEKIEPSLQDLCVSVLDDSRKDIEKSIEGITEYITAYHPERLRSEMNRAKAERQQVIDQLAGARRELFALINQEYESIVYNGESISPTNAAAFVAQNAGELNLIPGEIAVGEVLPLSFSEIVDLYRSNADISGEDEKELLCDLPSPDELLSPEDLVALYKGIDENKAEYQRIARANNWIINIKQEGRKILFQLPDRQFEASYASSSDIDELYDFVLNFQQIDPWMIQVAVDGRRDQYSWRWETLLDQIEETEEFSSSIVADSFGKRIEIVDTSFYDYEEEFKELGGYFKQGKKLTSIYLFAHKSIERALKTVLINGKTISTYDDCKIILNRIDLNKKREKCAAYWNELFASFDVSDFWNLGDDPEAIAKHWIRPIEYYLDWYQNVFVPLVELLNRNGIRKDELFAVSALDSDYDAIEKVVYAIEAILPDVCRCLKLVIAIEGALKRLSQMRMVLEFGQRKSSVICNSLGQALSNRLFPEYSMFFQQLRILYEKKNLKKKREELLLKLRPYAPQWADAIANRYDIHGQAVVPDRIMDAWKWKQLSALLSEMAENSYQEKMEECAKLSKKYRETTARYAEYSAWYNLSIRINDNVRQNLQGWLLDIKSIGKGTGNRALIAARLKAAREKMKVCQSAVPVWIMPINRALESFTPGVNSFDVVIIDEASQADLSSLSILYMGKKLIIVGDDKQVSPMAVGADIGKLMLLQQAYLNNKIPNADIYDGKRSIYDIAKTTFQPLMLREHFRCVPQIIAFSNKISYDFKIKPLRDASTSNLLPAVVNYCVKDGHRDGKKNRNEALAIVALLKACIEQPEYAGKSFGVISMLGTDQAKLIQRYLYEAIDPEELQTRRVLCGDAPNFQGDERDVIFLSLVDSSEQDGPLALKQADVQDNGKRYNVAASRARDQLWVVDSLDPSFDLKGGDIRRELIEFSLNPDSPIYNPIIIDQKSDSPFEAAVAKSLVAKGYHIIQQWKAGAYRIDMVAVCGKKKVAIECDGERWHSGENKIREDVERQTILERIGWRFIRIRGSEYYRNPENTIKRVIDELNSMGIQPESTEELINIGQDSELLIRVKAKADSFLTEITSKNNSADDDFLLSALGDVYSRSSSPKKRKGADKNQKLAPEPAAIPEKPVSRQPITPKNPVPRQPTSPKKPVPRQPIVPKQPEPARKPEPIITQPVTPPTPKDSIIEDIRKSLGVTNDIALLVSSLCTNNDRPDINREVELYELSYLLNGDEERKDEAQTKRVVDYLLNQGNISPRDAGILLEYNSYTAYYIYKKAAEKGLPNAQCDVGNAYFYGLGINQNYKIAVRWYTSAAMQHYARAESNLGYCYESAKGVRSSLAAAVVWYKRAAEKGYSDAQFNLGRLYFFGKGVSRDYNAALTLFKAAAEQGDKEAEKYITSCMKAIKVSEL